MIYSAKVLFNPRTIEESSVNALRWRPLPYHQILGIWFSWKWDIDRDTRFGNVDKNIVLNNRHEMTMFWRSYSQVEFPQLQMSHRDRSISLNTLIKNSSVLKFSFKLNKLSGLIKYGSKLYWVNSSLKTLQWRRSSHPSVLSSGSLKTNGLIEVSWLISNFSVPYSLTVKLWR